MIRLVVGIALAVTGCKGKASPEELRAAAKDTGSTCEGEAVALAKLLREAPHEPAIFQAQHGLTLVSRPDLAVTKMPSAPVVIMTRVETTYQGRLVGHVSELGEQLEASHAIIAASPTERGLSSTLLYFQIDREVPWSRIVPLVEAAEHAGFTTPAFVFEAPAKLAPPPRSPIDDKLDAMTSNTTSNQATNLASLMTDVVKDCAALQRAFGAVGASDSGNKADFVIESLAPALIECKCAADIPSLRSILWRLLVVAPVIRIVTFDAKRETTLALPGATTWADASKRFTSATMPGMRLAIE